MGLRRQQGIKVTNVARKGMMKKPLYREDKSKKEEENTDNYSPIAWNEEENREEEKEVTKGS